MPVPLAAGIYGFIGYTLGKLSLKLFYRVSSAVGVGVITYVGVDAFIGHYEQLIQQNLTALPPQAAQVFGILRIDKFLSIVISSVAAKVAFLAAKKFIGVR